MGFLKSYLVLTFIWAANAEQKIGPAATRAAEVSGASAATSVADKLLATLRLINVTQYNHRNEDHADQEGPPANDPKRGILHPYEWDSRRTAEEMLSDGKNGSCGTHGLSLAAVLRASGVPSSEIRIIGGVDVNHYREICPGNAKQPRAREWNFDGVRDPIHPASGHVFVMVRWGGEWHLVNSTHNPRDPGPDIEPTKTEPAKLTLGDFEMTTLSPAVAVSLLNPNRPVLIPEGPFPSYFRNRLPNGQRFAPILPFTSWSFEDYPVHGAADRLNLVASGTMESSVCRWSAQEIESLTKVPSRSHSRSRRSRSRPAAH